MPEPSRWDRISYYSNLLRNAGLVLCVGSVVYELLIKGLILETLGVKRNIEPIENFPWDCRRVVHKQLEGCEDLWLDEEDRVLYGACSGSVARGNWNPALGRFNISGRRTQGSELMAIYIDEPTTGDQFRMHKIEPRGYQGAIGDGTLDTVGFDVENRTSSGLRFYLTDHRPPVSDKGEYLDATKLGSNATIEVFDYKKGSKHMQHLKTFASRKIHSANKLALTGDGGFFVSNDHSVSVGGRRELDMLIGGGNVVKCDADGACKASTHNNLRFPNGLIRGTDDLIYVPFSMWPYVGVYKQEKNGKLKHIYRIKIGQPTDNLSVDSKGDIWATAAPNVMGLIDAVLDPFEKSTPSAVFRIRKKGEKDYEVEKVLEDRDTKALNANTVTVHDAKTARLFLGGAATPYLVVCAPRPESDGSVKFRPDSQVVID